MRIALVCPYSWSYPGGVTNHVHGLAETLRTGGHDVTVMAPVDPPGRLSRMAHLGADPRLIEEQDYLLPLGRTAGIPINGAVSALGFSPVGFERLGHEARHGGYDVVHVHEPDAPPVGWIPLMAARAALVGTFHTYNEHRLSHTVGALAGVRLVLNHLHVRIAVSQAAAWTGRRYFGGRYRVIPNGVDIGAAGAAPAPPGAPPGARAAGAPPAWPPFAPGRDGRLRIVFVGQPVPRKGLPVLLRAFELLQQTVPAELGLVGPELDDVEPLLIDRTKARVRVLGKVGDARKFAEIAAADVLCAPSSGGESFGMVLIEAFASGVPVVASDVPGYREIVRHGVNGLLVPPGDPERLAEVLKSMWARPETRSELAAAASAAAARFAWPAVAGEVLHAYEDAIRLRARTGAGRRLGTRLGLTPADDQPKIRPERLPSLEDQGSPEPTLHPRRSRLARTAATAAVWLAAVVLAWLAIRKMGFHNVSLALARANLAVAAATVGLMCVSMGFRAVAWHASLKAALPDEQIRLADATSGVMIGVLVSSTLPANLGEALRATIIARRTTRPWTTIAVVAGTQMSQTLINIGVVVVLGAVTFATANLFGHLQTGVEAGLGCAALLVAVLVGSPLLFRRAKDGSLPARVRTVLTRVRGGLVVFRHRRLGAIAVISMLLAWAVQWAAVYILLVGMHLSDQAGAAAAAAVLFAVNLTMILPLTPGNLGVFQAATAFVLNAGWGVPYSRGVAFGVVLQAAELTAALVTGVPALVRERMSWRMIALSPQANARENEPSR